MKQFLISIGISSFIMIVAWLITVMFNIIIPYWVTFLFGIVLGSVSYALVGKYIYFD